MSTLTEDPGSVGGRILECGREKGGRNEVVIEVGRGQNITISGLSDTVTKQFAMNLYKYVLVTFGVQHDG